MVAHRAIVRVGGVGDTLLLAPALAILRSKYSGKITLIGYQERLAILVAAGLADSMLNLDEWLVGSLDNGTHETLVDSFFPQGPERFPARIRFHSPFPSEAEPIHAAEHIAKCLQISLPAEPTAPLSKLLGAIEKRQTLWIHPGSGSREKCWPLVDFLRAADSLSNQGRELRFLLGEAEAGMPEAIRAAGFEVTSENSLREIPGLWSRNDAFLGNDSGITHLAALCGLPTLAIFKSSDPDRWRPWGPRAGFIRGGDGVDWPSVHEVVNAFLELTSSPETLSSP